VYSEGIRVCKICGESETILIESDRPNYNDRIPDKPGYPYKRINHLNEWISKFQARRNMVKIY